MASVKGKKILIVDSDQKSASDLQRFAHEASMRASTADSSSAAIHQILNAQLNQAPFDILMYDVAIGKDGAIDLAKRLASESSQFRDLAIVLLAGSINDADIADMPDVMVSLVASKPATSTDFLQVIVNILRIKSKKSIRSAVNAPELPGDMRVLVVENNPVGRQVMAKMLKNCGLNASFAVNGREAVDLVKAEEKPFDVVFMDVDMPELDGYQATAMIRQWEEENSVFSAHIVALTALSMDEEEQRYEESQLDDFLMKPIAFAELKSYLATTPVAQSKK